MKFLILLVTLFAMNSWAQDEFNPDAPNMKIGLYPNPRQTQAATNNPYSAKVETATTGGTSATCPECGDPSQLPDNTAFIRQSGTTTGTGETTDGQQ
jgi:hypothetical protein